MLKHYTPAFPGMKANVKLGGRKILVIDKPFSTDDEELQKRIRKSLAFQRLQLFESDEEASWTPPDPDDESTPPTQDAYSIDELRELGVKELRGVAKSMKIKTHRLSRENLISSIIYGKRVE